MCAHHSRLVGWTERQKVFRKHLTASKPPFDICWLCCFPGSNCNYRADMSFCFASKLDGTHLRPEMSTVTIYLDLSGVIRYVIWIWQIPLCFRLDFGIQDGVFFIIFIS